MLIHMSLSKFIQITGTNSSMLLKVVILVAVSAVFVESMELETKIRRIWNDIDIATHDGRVTVAEVELYFYNFSLGSGEVIYPNFDYLWSEWYGDSRQVTQYLFDTWNVFPIGAPDSRLTVEDLAILFNDIDTNLNLACPTNGYWDFFWEFHPYFSNLYKRAPVGRTMQTFGRRS